MTFRNGIISESFRIANRRLAFILAAVIGQFAVHLAEETLISNIGLTFASAIIWSMLAFIAHSECLHEPDDQEAMDIARVFGFAVRVVCLTAMAAIPSVFLMSAFPVSQDPELAAGAYLVAIVPTFAVAGIFVFSLFGTILPGYVSEERDSISDALRCGSEQFMWIAARLLLSALAGIFAVALLVAPVIFFGAAGLTLSGGYIPNPLVMPFALAAYTLLAWSIMLTAVILSRAYLRDAENEAPVFPGPSDDEHRAYTIGKFR